MRSEPKNRGLSPFLPLKEEYLLTGLLETTNECYTIAKIAGVKMCQANRHQYSFNAISLMPTNLYGPNDNFDLESSHVLPAMIRKFHLAKLAMAGDVEAIKKDEAAHGPIPQEIKQALRFPSHTTSHPKLYSGVQVTPNASSSIWTTSPMPPFSC